MAGVVMVKGLGADMGVWGGGMPCQGAHCVGGVVWGCAVQYMGWWWVRPASSGHIAQDMPGSIPHPEAKLGRARLVLW